MPKPQEKQQPSLDDLMQAAFTKVKGEYPDIKPVDLSPSTSFLSKWMMPKNSLATTNPLTGNIMYDPNMMQGQSQTDIEQTLAHELRHSQQAQQTPWWQSLYQQIMPGPNVPPDVPANSPLNSPYHWRPAEMDAFQAERDRAMKNHLSVTDPETGAMDIPLPSMKTRQRYMGGK